MEDTSKLPFKPLKMDIGGVYDNATHFFQPLGINAGEMDGKSLCLLVGKNYDKNFEEAGVIEQVLPLVIDAHTKQMLGTGLLTETDIRFLLRNSAKYDWSTLTHFSAERAFYEKYVSDKRKNTNKKAEIVSLSVPLSEEFFYRNKYIKLDISGKLSMQYGKVANESEHLADCSVIHFVDRNEDKKVVREFLLPVFISDDDKMTIALYEERYGANEGKVLIDSDYMKKCLDYDTKHFRGNENCSIELINDDIEAGDEIEINEPTNYIGNLYSVIKGVLKGIRTLRDSEGYYTMSNLTIGAEPKKEIKEDYVLAEKGKTLKDARHITEIRFLPNALSEIVKVYDLDFKDCSVINLIPTS